MDRKELEAIVIKAVATIYGKDESELPMATNIKEELGADHLYLCTQSQYTKVLKTAAEKESEQKMEQLKNLAESKGINTDIHFGE